MTTVELFWVVSNDQPRNLIDSFHNGSTQEGLQRRLHSAARVKRETRVLFGGSVALGPNFTEMGSSPAKMFIPFDI